VLNRKLEYLLALAKEGHFAKAAEACHVSQPTLSAAIQQLETEMGVPIVKRGQRFQGLTAQGQLILEAATRMAEERDRLIQQLRTQRENSSGTLRIGVLGSTVPLIKSFTFPFRKQFPYVNLSVTVQSPFDLQQALETSAVDVAISYLDQRLRRLARVHALYTEEYDLLIRKGTALSGRASIAWSDLKGLPLCLLSPDSPLFGKAESKVLGELLAATPHIVSNAIWLVMDHVRSGHWASVLPKPVRIMVAADEDLEAIPLPALGAANTVAIAKLKRKPAAPLADAFFDIAVSDKVIGALNRALAGGQNQSGSRPR
jgi:DNA-binding transcriptional LysR family regulator